jgi:hypothetical protein
MPREPPDRGSSCSLPGVRRGVHKLVLRDFKQQTDLIQFVNKTLEVRRGQLHQGA